MALAIRLSRGGRKALPFYRIVVADKRMARDGRVDEAERILDELGRIEPYNEELSALRDKANLALGYAYLQAGDAKAARKPLQRVRLNGPFSNKALLGVGWADAELEDYISEDSV